MYGNADPDDDWSRFRRVLDTRRREILAELGSGGCEDIGQYRHYCGRLAMIAEVLEIATAIRRGEDLAPPPQRPPLLSPED